MKSNRVWNSQFVAYAGYKVDETTIIGDRSQIEFTEVIKSYKNHVLYESNYKKKKL